MIGPSSVTLVGNLTDDPDMRFTASGVALVKFRMAVSQRVFDKNTNEWSDGEPTFVDVTAWRDLAEHIAETLGKGARAIVLATVRMETWEDKETGGKRSRISFTAEAVGAELTFATASVTRAGKGGGGSKPAARRRDDDEAERPAARRQQGGGAAPASRGGGGRANTGFDEEPPF